MGSEDLKVRVLLGAKFDVDVTAIALHAVKKIELVGQQPGNRRCYHS